MEIIKLFNKYDKEAMSLVLIIWTVISGVVLGLVFDLFSTPFFSFGPSDNLYTIGINYNINSWSKYAFVSIFLVVQGFITNYIGDALFPWINSVVLNPDADEIKMPKVRAWFVTNNTYFLFVCLSLLSLGMSMSQFDLFVYSNAAGLAAGWIQSAIRLNAKIYKKDEIVEVPLEEVV